MCKDLFISLPLQNGSFFVGLFAVTVKCPDRLPSSFESAYVLGTKVERGKLKDFYSLPFPIVVVLWEFFGVAVKRLDSHEISIHQISL